MATKPKRHNSVESIAEVSPFFARKRAAIVKDLKQRTVIEAKVVDAHSGFLPILEAWQQLPRDQRSLLIADRLTGALGTWLTWAKKRKSISTEGTTRDIMDLCESVINGTLGTSDTSSKKSVRFFTDTLQCSLSASTISQAVDARIRALELVALVTKAPEYHRIDKVLGNEKIRMALHELQKGLVNDLPRLCTENRVIELSRCLSASKFVGKSHFDFSTPLREALLKILETDSASVPLDVRQVLATNNISLSKQAQDSMVLAAREESSEVRGLAALLLATWDSRSEGNKGRAAFDQAASFFRETYRVRLFGETTEPQDFDPRKHELSDRSTARRVLVIRPGAEYFDGTSWAVVLKALVGPEGDK